MPAKNPTPPKVTPPKVAPKKPVRGIGYSEPDMGRGPTDAELNDMLKPKPPKKPRRSGDGLDMIPNRPGAKCGGKMGKYAKGGGIEKKGKTKGTMIKMAKGGSLDGVALRGKTRAKGFK